MKNLTLSVISILFSFITYSQTFVFNVTEMISYRAKGNLTYNETKQNATWKTPLEPTNCSYEFDMTNKTSTFYNNGVKISTLKFSEVSKNGDVYTIKVLDYDKLNPSEVIETVYTINTKSMKFFMSWFIPSTNFTRAQFHTKTTSSIK
jgi:glycyl-tRNA synthetase beta subunit